VPRTRNFPLLFGLLLLLIACRCSKTGCYVQVPFGPLEYRDPCPTPTPTPLPHVPVGQEYRLSTLGSFEKPIGDFCWSADGRSIFVFALSMKEVQQLRVPDGALMQTYSGNTDVISALAVSPDGQWLVTGASHNPIRLWRVGNAKPEREIPVTLPGVQALAFSGDSKTFGVGLGDPLNYEPKDKALELYRVADGARVWSAPYERTPGSLSFSPDGKAVAVLTDLFNLKVHSAITGALLFEKVIGGAPRTVTYSADGKWLAVATYSGVDLFSAPGEVKSRFADTQGVIAFTPDSKRLVTAALDINVRNLSDGKVWRAMTEPDLRRARISPDGSLLATTSWLPGAQYPSDHRFHVQLWRIKEAR
jgi:WD40 repeat protein